MSTQQALALPSLPPSNAVVINPRCSLRIEADQRVIVVAGLPMHHYRVEDAVAEAYAMVFLVESGFAQQTDVARAFSQSVRTIRRTKSAVPLAGWQRSVARKGVRPHRASGLPSPPRRPNASPPQLPPRLPDGRPGRQNRTILRTLCQEL